LLNLRLKQREREISCADLLQNLNQSISNNQPTNQASNKTLPHSKTNTNIARSSQVSTNQQKQL
jgi:hypothetical protein